MTIFGFYFIALLLCFLTAYVVDFNSPVLSKRTRAASFIFIVLPIFIFGLTFIGFRPIDSGGDTVPYVNAYGRISSIISAKNDAIYGSEWLFWPFQAILKHLLDTRAWLAVNYLVAFVLSFLAYRRLTRSTPYSSLLFCLAFLTYYGVYSGNAMRQVYSLPISIIAFCFLFERRFISYGLCLTLSCLFHWSSLIFIAAYPLLLLPNRSITYIFLPLLCFIAARLSAPILAYIASILEVPWFTQKINLYFFGGRESHIESVFATANFWLCIGTYIMLVALRVYKDTSGEMICKLYLFVLAVMLFSSLSADVPERYMAWLLFTLPLAWFHIFARIRMPVPLKNILLIIGFYSLGLMVYTRESSQMTLGLN